MEALKLVVVTGCNKGIGFGIVENLVQKQYKVIMACRNLELATQSRLELLEKTKVDPSKIEVAQLDVSSSASIDSFLNEFAQKWKYADILVNNAGAATKGDTFDDEVVKSAFQTNFYGTVELTEKFIPFLKENGKIVSLGSFAGLSKIIKNDELRDRFNAVDLTREQLFGLAKDFYESVKAGNYLEKGFPKSGYGMSKLCLNQYHRVLGKNPAVLNKKIQVSVCCPGYVNTDMTSHKGHKTVEQGAITPLWLIEQPDQFNEELQGKFFSEQKVVAI